MLLPQKFECKGFLILTKRIVHIWFWYLVFVYNRGLLAMLALQINSRTSGDSRDWRNCPKFSLWNCWVRGANNDRDVGFDRGVQIRVGKSATLAERRSNEVCSATKSKEKSRERILGEWI